MGGGGGGGGQNHDRSMVGGLMGGTMGMLLLVVEGQEHVERGVELNNMRDGTKGNSFIEQKGTLRVIDFMLSGLSLLCCSPFRQVCCCWD